MQSALRFAHMAPDYGGRTMALVLAALTLLQDEMSHSHPPSISIVVPVYNGGDAFRRCLASLSRYTPHPEVQTAGNAPTVEIIVVSDGDSDGSWRLAEEFGAKLIRRSESKGPAMARNEGAAAATGDILFFVDADVEILPDTIALVAESFRTHPQLAALIGSYDDAPGDPSFLSQYKNLFHHYTHQTASLSASTFWGACGAIRRPIFNEMGALMTPTASPA